MGEPHDDALRRLESYNAGPIKHLKQIAFHKMPQRNRWVFGGNRTGKTQCGAIEAIWHARGIHPYRKLGGPTNGWVVSLTHEVQRDVAQQKILDFLPKDWIARISMRRGARDDPDGGVIDFIDVHSVFGGLSRIGFKSCDQGRQRFQGSSLDYVWFDEEPPHEIYRECLMRVLDRRGNIWGTMTPLLGLTWVHEVIYLNRSQDPEIAHIRIQWEDNPFLPEDEVRRMKRVLSAQELQSRHKTLPNPGRRSMRTLAIHDFSPGLDTGSDEAMLPMIVNHRITIQLAGNTHYRQQASLSALMGTGVLQILSDGGAATLGGLDVSNCQLEVHLDHLIFDAPKARKSAVTAMDCRKLVMGDVHLVNRHMADQADRGGRIGICAVETQVHLEGCTAANFYAPLEMQAGTARLFRFDGGGNTYGLRLTDGCIVTGSGPLPRSRLGAWQDGSCIVHLEGTKETAPERA